MTRYLLNLLNSIVGAVAKVGWVEVIDVLIVAVIFYQLLKLVRGTRAAELIVGLVLLSVVGVVASTLKLILLSWLFQNAAPFVVIAVIVLFQPELRRALDQVGRLSHLNFQLSQFNPQAFNRGVAEAIRAAERLSARKTGRADRVRARSRPRGLRRNRGPDQRGADRRVPADDLLPQLAPP